MRQRNRAFGQRRTLSPKVARFWLLAILFALTALLSLNGRILWTWISTKRVHYERIEKQAAPFSFSSFPIRVTGWFTVRRWVNPPLRQGRAEEYWIHNGRKVKREETEYRDGKMVRTTRWSLLGTVRRQTDFEDDQGNLTRIGKSKSRPPWWWGVEDQKEPVYVGDQGSRGGSAPR